MVEKLDRASVLHYTCVSCLVFSAFF